MGLELLTSADAVHAAMDEYDSIGGAQFLKQYGFGQARSYFIERNGKLYDSKAIAAVAVGKEHPERGPLRSDEFSGGDATVKSRLNSLGFEVVGPKASQQSPVPQATTRLFATLMTKALSGFDLARRGPHQVVSELWEAMDALAEDLRSRPSLRSRPDILVKWSLGRGVWAKVPWIALLDRRVTTTTQSGVYIVFLIAEDLSRVYLTLNQGMTELVQQHKQAGAIEAMRRRAEEVRTHVPELSQRGFTLGGDIDLATDGWRSKNYEYGTIAYVELTAGALPDDAELELQLESLLEAYERATSLTQPGVTPRPCWFVGSTWDDEDQTARFLTEGIWENGYDEGPTLDEVRQMAPGDRVAIKASFVRKHGLPFPNPEGRSVSTMRIKAVGTIRENSGDGRRILVDWEPAENSREWFFYTNRATIWRVEAGAELTDRLIAFTFDGEPQDYTWFLEQPYLATPQEAARRPFSIDDAVQGLFLDRDAVERMLRIWRAKTNLILEGPPGVGKSFIARRLGYALMGEEAPERMDAVQFHQSYGYEDFVQGYRPNGQGGFELRDGVFYRFCQRAMLSDCPHVFIIDEINRGNLSKVFGELMLLVEADKRGEGWETQLAYAGPGDAPFSVPKNVFILGMMNTADRSLSMVDYALRRRFAFIPLEPAFDSLKFAAHLAERKVPAEMIRRVIDGMTALNQAIAEDAANLGPGFRIGHSYFTPTKPVDDAEAWFEQIIETEIEPLLGEYWFDDPSKAKVWRERLRTA